MSRAGSHTSSHFLPVQLLILAVDLAQIFQIMVGFIVVIEFHINSCRCALFVLDLRCSAKKMKVPTRAVLSIDLARSLLEVLALASSRILLRMRL